MFATGLVMIGRATNGGLASSRGTSTMGMRMFDSDIVGAGIFEPMAKGTESWTRSSGGPDTVGERIGES